MYPQKFTQANIEASIAANRFGYGTRQNQLAEIEQQGARAWLKEQLYTISFDPNSNLLRTGGGYSFLSSEYQRNERNLPQFKFRDLVSRSKVSALIIPDLVKRISIPVYSPFPFHERLVRFWMNHFLLNNTDLYTHPLILAFENDVVRRLMNGSYVDMLMAAMHHPAMLIIHQNALSAGRYSEFANNDDRFLNPKLARILIERFTIGSAHEKAEHAIIVLTDMLTGWSVSKNQSNQIISFEFKPELHAPGTKNLFSRPYRESGIFEAEAAISLLCNMPETGINIAYKLCLHFLSDRPNTALVDQMALSFLNNETSLPKTLETMIDSPISFSTNFEKVKSPEDLVYSLVRGFDFEVIKSISIGTITDNTSSQMEVGHRILSDLIQLGQPPLYGNPDRGWIDTKDYWVLPDQLRPRINWCQAAALARPQYFNGKMLADHLLMLMGPLLSAELYTEVSNSLDGINALKLFIAHPLFQRR